MTTVAADMTEEQRSVLGRIEKLLRLAGSNPNREEAASAAAKAQDLLLAYNLDASAIGGSEDGRRMEEKLRGGFYQFERDLWHDVAEINFCMHWVQQEYVERPEKDRNRRKVQERYSSFARQYRKVTRHHLVGKRVSVASTKFMTEYLLATIERLTKEFLIEDRRGWYGEEVVGLGGQLRSRRATSFRRGVASAIRDKLWERRSQQMDEERRRQREEERRHEEALKSGVSSATSLTISSVKQAERDANMDFLYGEGWSARQRADQAARAAAVKAAEEEYTRWAAAHPEEAKAEEERRRKEQREQEKKWARRRGRAPRAERDDTDWGAFRAGEDVGRTVGLDPQAEHASAPRRIAG